MFSEISFHLLLALIHLQPKIQSCRPGASFTLSAKWGVFGTHFFFLIIDIFCDTKFLLQKRLCMGLMLCSCWSENVVSLFSHCITSRTAQNSGLLSFIRTLGLLFLVLNMPCYVITSRTSQRFARVEVAFIQHSAGWFN